MERTGWSGTAQATPTGFWGRIWESSPCACPTGVLGWLWDLWDQWGIRGIRPVPEDPCRPPRSEHRVPERRHRGPQSVEPGGPAAGISAGYDPAPLHIPVHQRTEITPAAPQPSCRAVPGRAGPRWCLRSPRGEQTTENPRETNRKRGKTKQTDNKKQKNRQNKHFKRRPVPFPARNSFGFSRPGVAPAPPLVL